MPTLAPLLDLPLERILVTQGPPTLTGAAAALRQALSDPLVHHRG